MELRVCRLASALATTRVAQPATLSSSLVTHFVSAWTGAEEEPGGQRSRIEVGLHPPPGRRVPVGLILPKSPVERAKCAAACQDERGWQIRYSFGVADGFRSVIASSERAVKWSMTHRSWSTTWITGLQLGHLVASP